MKKILNLIFAAVIVAVISSAFCVIGASAEGKKLVAITFDDGPSKNTPVILDALKEYGAKVTFFTVGNRIASYTDTVKRIVDEGHQLAGHSYSHANLKNLSYGDAKNEMDSGIATIAPFAKYGTYLIRPPYGAHNDVVESVGYPLIIWSVDTLDWKSRNADSVYQNLMSMTKDGSIMLLHDLYDTSVAGAIRAIPELQAQGYEFVTVSELFRRRGITIEGGGVYTNASPNGNDLPAVAAPEITEADEGGVKKAKMAVNASGFNIYYTMDGSTPTVGSTKYTVPVEVKQPTTFKAIAIDTFGTRSPVGEKKIVANACENVKFILSGGNLTLTTATQGATIYYTTDGSVPTAGSTKYTAPFKVNSTVRAVAVMSGLSNSSTLSLCRSEYGDLFTDVDKDKWYFDTVGEVFHRGMFSGIADYTFAPETSLSRAMFVTLLSKLSGDDLSGYSETGSKFNDVPDNSWYAKAVAWASEAEITAGYDNGGFGPNDLISREQMCVMLAKFMSRDQLVPEKEISAEPFDDTDSISEWARDAVAKCHAIGLVSGVGDNSFNPKGTATRAESAAVLLAFSNKRDSGELVVLRESIETTSTTSTSSSSSKEFITTALKFTAITILSLIVIFVLLVAFFRIKRARRRSRRRAARALYNSNHPGVSQGDHAGTRHLSGQKK